jgi:indolepyruvate ferredoxin oxidoreductase, beta subunit
MAKDTPRPITLLIAAMGGEGGGVLTSWIVAAARKSGFPVQATSIPGVAQRTGATSYYIELIPATYAEIQDREPVLDLYPAPADMDIAIATELVETGRVLEKGFVTPDRTLLIASTHRIYAMGEKMAMGDGRFDSDKIMAAAKQMAKKTLLFDMEKAAADSGSVINSVILGAISGAGALPITREIFEETIKEEGIAVKANLKGFAAGIAYGKGEVVELKRKAATTLTPQQLQGPQYRTHPAGEALKARIEKDFPKSLHPLILEACGRTLDYQDAKYARLYLDRLDTIVAIDRARNDNDWKITSETARHLGLRMTFEDVIRVAQLKTRPSRMARVRREVQAAPEQLVKQTEFLKPGIDEFTSLMPPWMARPLLRWAEKTPTRKKKTHIGMYIRTDTFFGYMKLRMMAGMRFWRRAGYRYKEEQKQIEAWLELVRQSAALGKDFALEVIELARLIKGYGSTHKRGSTNFDTIVAAIVRPALAAKRGNPAAVKKARDAALADPEGETLGKTLAELTAPVPARAAE